jgi:hypothetical protein
LIEAESFFRALAFAVIFAGIEYRYVNRREAKWTREMEGFYEKPAFWVVSPYHVYLLLPLFIAVSFSTVVTAWAGNVFMVALAEDVGYFVWRGRGVDSADWTTTLAGSFRVGGAVIPVWWPAAAALVLLLYLAPF